MHHLDFLDVNKETNEDSVIYVANQLSSVVAKSDHDKIRTEVRLFNLRDRQDKPTGGEDEKEIHVDAAEQWHKIDKEQFPHLCRLAGAVCTLFHGNSDAERNIGKSHDIDDDEKRNTLSGEFCSVDIFIKDNYVLYLHMLLFVTYRFNLFTFIRYQSQKPAT